MSMISGSTSSDKVVETILNAYLDPIIISCQKSAETSTPLDAAIYRANCFSSIQVIYF
jgi:hypothetical protein